MEVVLVTTTLWFTNAFAQSDTKNKNQSPHLAEVKEGTNEVEIVRLARETLVVT